MLYAISISKAGVAGYPIFTEQQVTDILNKGGTLCLTRFQLQLAIEYLNQPIFVFDKTYPRWQEIGVIKKMLPGIYILAIEDKLELFQRLTEYAKARLLFILENEVEQGLKRELINIHAQDIESFNLDELELRFLTPRRFVAIAKRRNRRDLIASYNLNHHDALTLTYLSDEELTAFSAAKR
ncbi:hypothetical protein VTH8203_00829 [Vibrio thalassae]|uniref:Uncharacterized protein n=1 Tax=Vibrio thalassae TaxID=1243014 RepID=A0A240EEW0_9VIBR|nr:hypothetical protein [Vibrio thalassae]SNX47228.1 hypothetical protein VTH8203_00829 [Vibrio thalassae]